MPEVKYTFPLPGRPVPLDLVGLARPSVRDVPKGSVQTPALAAALATVGVEWAWLDYLSPGDAVRVVWLLDMIENESKPPDGFKAACDALAEIRRVAEERMAVDQPPG